MINLDRTSLVFYYQERVREFQEQMHGDGMLPEGETFNFLAADDFLFRARLAATTLASIENPTPRTRRQRQPPKPLTVQEDQEIAKRMNQISKELGFD